MSKFNIDRIRQIMGEINSSLSKLEIISKSTEEDFLSSAEKIDSSKYNLIVAIEGAIDICNHIVAKAGGRAPCDYADCFQILGELKIFSDDFVQELKKLARFRNLLVHLYWHVDNRRVYALIRDIITHLRVYIERIGKFIEATI